MVPVRKTLVHIIDGDPIHRSALSVILSGIPAVESRSSTGIDGLCDEHRKPDIVMVNYDHPDICARFLLCAILRALPEVPVLCYSQSGAPVCDGLCCSESRVIFLTYTDVMESLEQYIQEKPDMPVIQDSQGDKGLLLCGVRSLSPKETDIFCLFSKGLHAQSIAERLGSSVRTVETHLRNIRRKLRVGNSEELRIFANAYREVCACRVFNSSSGYMCTFRTTAVGACPCFSC